MPEVSQSTNENLRKVRIDSNAPVFKGELKKSAFNNDRTAGQFTGEIRLLEFVNDPRFVVRKPPYPIPGGKSEILKTCITTKKLFAELESIYGIPVPARFVVARDSVDQVTFYIITDKVEVVDVDKLSQDEQAAARAELKGIFESLMTYYENKVQTGGPYLDEVMDDQYVYGTVEGRPGRRWYLVDTDPVYSEDFGMLKSMLDDGDEKVEDLEAICGLELEDLRERFRALRKKLSRRRKK